MNTKKRESLTSGILFFVAGILFIISAVIGEDTNLTFISLGCSFIVLGIVFGIKYKTNSKNKDNK